MARVAKKECIATIGGKEFTIEIGEVPGKGSTISHPELPDGIHKVSSVHHEYFNDVACGTSYLKCIIKMELDK